MTKIYIYIFHGHRCLLIANVRKALHAAVFFVSANYQFISFHVVFSVGIRVNIVIDSASFCIIIVLLVDSFRFVNRVLVYFQVSELNLGRSWAAG